MSTSNRTRRFYQTIDVTYRYSAIVGVLQNVFETLGGRTVLDVGGLGAIRHFLPQSVSVTEVNPDPMGVPGVIVGDARALPFADQSFDAVVFSDVLEHVEKKDIPKILSEAARVAKHVVVVSGPLDTPAAKRFDTRYNQIRQALTGQDEPWLAEHFKFGLPPESAFQKLPGFAHHFVIPQMPLALLELASWIDLLAAIGSTWTKELTRARDFAVNQFGVFEQFGPTYRHVWVALRQPSALGPEDFSSSVASTQENLEELSRLTKEAMQQMGPELEARLSTLRDQEANAVRELSEFDKKLQGGILELRGEAERLQKKIDGVNELYKKRFGERGLRDLEKEIETMIQERDRLRGEYVGTTQSKSYRLAESLWKLRKVVRI
jgi:SAM-dependent methyltransferase